MPGVSGILVHGDNHFIVRGPRPDREAALALVRHWSVIQIGASVEDAMPLELASWRMITKEFRENLGWAVVVPGESENSPAVRQLLAEIAARGIEIYML